MLMSDNSSQRDKITVRVPASLKVALERLAEISHRDLSKQVCFMLDKGLKEEGVDHADESAA
jgi:hypothetical protein